MSFGEKIIAGAYQGPNTCGLNAGEGKVMGIVQNRWEGESIVAVSLGQPRYPLNLGPIWVSKAGSKNSLEDQKRAVSTVEIQ